MTELKGKPVADSIYSQISKNLSSWAAKNWNPPHLAVVLVGDDPASGVYVSHKEKACQNLNIKSTLLRLSNLTTENELSETLKKLNQDPSVDGILLQLPLPTHLHSKKFTEMIAAEKDADGLTQASLGALMAGQQKVASCTPAGILEMIRFYNIDLKNKKVVVLGRSLIVGLPLMHLLIQADATVTLCHSKTENIKYILAEADVVCVAIGKPEFFRPTDFKKGAVVIDVGIHRTANGLCGDVSADKCEHLSAQSLVPGGVGPLTIAMLMKNTLTLAEARRKK